MMEEYTEQEIRQIKARREMIAYKNNFARERYDKLLVCFPKGEIMPRVKEMCKLNDESATSYIKRAVEAQLDKDEKAMKKR